MLLRIAIAGMFVIGVPAVAQQPQGDEEVRKNLDALPPDKRQKVLDDLRQALDSMSLMDDLQSGKCTRAAEVKIKAIQSDPQSIYMLSDMYRNGWCVTRDIEQFHNYLEQAAKMNTTGATFDLGFYYQNGTEGYPRSSQSASQWYEAGVRLNEPRSMIQLADMLMKGEGVSKDTGRGLRLLDTAANMDEENLEASNKALSTLAIAYMMNQLIPMDVTKARQYALRGATQCDGSSMLILGTSYQMIQPFDPVSTYAWALVASQHIDEKRKPIVMRMLADSGKQLNPAGNAKAIALSKTLPVCLPLAKRKPQRPGMQGANDENETCSLPRHYAGYCDSGSGNSASRANERPQWQRWLSFRDCESTCRAVRSKPTP
jgi:Sel1 repeat